MLRLAHKITINYHLITVCVCVCKVGAHAPPEVQAALKCGL